MKLHTIVGLTLFAITLSFASLTGTAHAEEQWQPFLESLRAAGYHDMAILYLDRMAARPDCPPELKEVLDYERGITLLSQPVASRKAQLEKLIRANDLFELFRKAHPDHPLAPKAQTQLANVLIERGRMLVVDSEEKGVTAAEKTKLLAEARKFYDEAKQVFTEQDKRLTEELKALPEPKTAVETNYRDALRADFLQTRLSLATADYEIGMTYPADNPERKKLLESSAKQYKYLYEKYGSFLAGLYARMWEGRCYQKLGDFSRATDALESIIMQADDSKAFRVLKNKSTALLIETLIDPKVKRYADALGFYKDWDKERPPSDASTPEGLQIRYLSALASLELAKTLEEDNKDRSKLLNDARSSLRFVMRFPGDTRTHAREKMADPLLATGDGEKQEPRDFAEAIEFGRAALDKIEVAQIQQQMGQQESLSEAELDTLKAEAEREATGYFEQAIQLAKPDTPIDEVNQVRYYLAYLYLKQGDLYRSAVFSDYLARRFPNSTVGRPASKIAMAVFATMMSKPGISPEERAFAQRRTEEAAIYITEVWPNSSEANEARKILVHSAIRDKNIKQAVTLVESIPADATGRGPLELLVGRALYGEYVRLMTASKKTAPEGETQEPDSQSSQPKVDPAEAESLLDQAKVLLVSGLRQSIEEGKIDQAFLAGELTLARIYLNASEDSQAIELVERPETGLLAIADAAVPSVIEGGLDIEAYKTSLRALVAVRKLDKASQVMELLEKRVDQANPEGGGTQLMQIYVSLAQELQQTLEMLQANGKTAEAAQVRASFEQFLDRVSSNQQAANFNIMQWIAATYSGLAESFETTENAALSPEAKGYYEKAVAVYQQIIKRYEEDETEKFAPSVEAIDTIQIRMAVCLRKLGQYKESLTHLYNVLKFRNTMVEAQVEAAYTYQAWAATNGKLYLNAMLGGVSKKRKSDGAKVNVIWGWGKLSKRFARDKKYRDLFHEARYNLALCRYKYALSDACKDKKKDLEAAARDITVVAKLYPEMGGAEMKAKYKTLYQQIKKALK